MNNPLRYTDKQGNFPILTLVVAGGIGAIANGLIYTVSNRDNFSWGDFGIAAGSGFVTGALCVVSGPTAGAVGKVFGAGATKAAAIGSRYINGFTGGAVNWAAQYMNIANGENRDIDYREVAVNAVLAGLLTYAGQKAFPIKSMNSFSQADFAPRTLQAFFKTGSPNASNIMADSLSEAFTGSVIQNYLPRTLAYVLNNAIDLGSGFYSWGVTESGSLIISSRNPADIDASEWE